MLDQDDSLDRLSESIGRQRELSIQIGDELESQGELLEDLDVVVDRSRSRLDGAKRRLDRFSRKAKDNGILLGLLCFFTLPSLLLSFSAPLSSLRLSLTLPVLPYNSLPRT